MRRRRLSPTIRFGRAYDRSAFHVDNPYTRKNGLPKEIHIKFVTKAIQDTVLFKANQTPVDFKGKQIRILKNTPFIISKKREDFGPFTKQLLAKGTSFKWLVPQGILFSHRGQSTKITSKDQLEHFLERHGDDFETTQEPKEGASSSDGDKEKKRDTVIKKMELRPKKKS